LRHGFPLLTTKKVLFSAVVRELLWFLSGSTNIYDGLHEYTPIWDAWASESGDLGPIYGHQFRNWGGWCLSPMDRALNEAGFGGGVEGPEHGVDQIAEARRLLKVDPNSRRNVVSAWNVMDLPKMRLPPCHILFQLYVVDGRLDLQFYQRSADLALGVPFNIASYALLLTMLAQDADLVPGVLIHTIGDAHVYLNHVEGLNKQLNRDPFLLPRVEVARKPFDEIVFEDVILHDYKHHPFIRFEVAV
jgi:thymidylate synthase